MVQTKLYTKRTMEKLYVHKHTSINSTTNIIKIVNLTFVQLFIVLILVDLTILSDISGRHRVPRVELKKECLNITVKQIIITHVLKDRATQLNERGCNKLHVIITFFLFLGAFCAHW